MESERREITLFNFDDSLLMQESLQKYPHHWIDCTDILHTNGFCEEGSLREIRKRILREGVGPLTFIGNGNYHYVSYLLLEQIKQPFSLVLFDHHADMMECESLISCGSWVRAALQDFPALQKIVIIGVNQEDYNMPQSSFHKRVLMIPEEKLRTVPLNILYNEIRSFLRKENNIYISIDKDVLYRTEAMTNWDQGSLSLVQLHLFLENLAQQYAVLGMDVCGEYRTTEEHSFKTSAGYSVQMNEIVNRSIIEYAIHQQIIQLKETSHLNYA